MTPNPFDTKQLDSSGAAVWAPGVRSFVQVGADGTVTSVGQPVAGMACPPLVDNVTPMIFQPSVAYKPLAGCSGITFTVNETTGAGVIVNLIGIWTIDQPIVNQRGVFSAVYRYNPTGTPDLGTGSGKYVGFNMTAVGGNCDIALPTLAVLAGGVLL